MPRRVRDPVAKDGPLPAVDVEPVDPEDLDPRTGTHLPPEERIQRDAQIVAARMRGLSWGQISATYGVSERRCREIHKAYREEHKTLRHFDPLEIVDDLLEGYQGTIEELAMIAATTAGDNARVGAINSKMVAMEKMSRLLQDIGVLPHDLGQLRVVVDARVVADQIMKVIVEYDLPEEVQEAMLTALQGQRAPLALAEGEQAA